ncbi:MAG: hypothetical protein AAFQ66_05205 [Pseudomonadota bacterium]
MTDDQQRKLFEALVAQSGLSFEEGREEMMFTVAKQIFEWSENIRPAAPAQTEPATAYDPGTIARVAS